MRELDHHPEQESRYTCDVCNDSGIDQESREYCECHLGKLRCNSDKFAEMYRSSPFTEAMWVMNQATMKVERATASAEKSLLIERAQRAEAAKLNAEGRAFELAQKLEAATIKWIPVTERLPQVEQLVMVYSPESKHSPEGIDMDYIDPNDDDHASWYFHNENYEHFCCVAKPEGATGPTPEARYTHWMAIPEFPAAPSPQPEKGE